MKNWKEPLPGFFGGIFSEQTMEKGQSNWGYILPFFLSNFVANARIEALAPTIASTVVGTVQTIALFPLQKFVLPREKKKKE